MALASAIDIMSILANMAKVYLKSNEYQPRSFGEFYRSTSRSTMLGSVTNLSSRTFQVKQFVPHYGKWTTKLPKGEINRYHPGGSGRYSTDYYLLFDVLHNISDQTKAKLAEALGHDAPAVEQAAWLADEDNYDTLWQFLNKDVTDCSMLMGCKGRWVGTEVALLLTDYEEPKRKIVLMIRHLPGGNTGAGISLSWGNWLNDSGKGLGRGGTCEEIADHIMENNTVRCKFSEETGRTKYRERVNGKIKNFYMVRAPTVTAKSNRLRVSVKAGKMPSFIIEEDR